MTAPKDSKIQDRFHTLKEKEIMTESSLNLKLILKATDGMSNTVKTACGKTSSAFDKTNKKLDETANKFDKTGSKAVKFSDKINFVKRACEQSDDAFEKQNKKLEDLAGKFENAGKKAAIFGGALVGAATVNAKLAGDFEQGMNNVATLIDTGTESLNDMSKKVLDIGKNSPKSLSDLTDGLYSIRSAGIEAAMQFDVLKGSEQLAVSGLATTAEAVDIATSAINAFGLKGKEADGIYNMFFKVVKYGKTNVSEFAQGFGSVAGVVASAGIKLDEYSASVAAMTTSGVKANIAHTQLKAAIAGLSRGSKEQTEIFNKLGSKSFADLVKKSGGMVNAFNGIYKAVGGNQAKLIQLVGSVEAYNAILSLTGANNETYLKTLNDMRYGGDSITEAYNKQMNGLNNQMAAMKNNLQVLSIKFGTALMPVIKAAGDGIKSLTALFDKMPDGLTSFLAIAAAGTGVISVFGGTALMFAGSLIRNFIMLQKVIRGFSIAAWANPALSPIIAVVGAIAALATGAVYCYKKFEGFRSVCNGLWAVIKAGGAWLAVLWNSFVTGAMKVWDFIKPAVKFAGVILSWTTPIGLVIKGISSLCKWIGNLIEKAGGFKAIGNIMSNWAADKQQKAEDLNREIYKAKHRNEMRMTEPVSDETKFPGKQNRTAQAAERQTKAKTDGSHALGLDYVPYDGYIAEVHKGEAILPKDEADLWRTSSNTVNNSNYANSSDITVNFSPVVNIQNATQEAKEDFLNILKQYKNEIADMVESAQNRRMARSY